jgi:hypothetical protein
MAVEMLQGAVLNVVVLLLLLLPADAKHNKFVAYWSPVFATVLLVGTGLGVT